MEETKPLKGIPLIFAAIALCVASLIILLDYSVANVSIPYIAGDLGVSANQGTYVITSFAIGTAIVLPLSGWLTKRIGMIRLFVVSLFGFVLFSWLCGVSFSLEMLVTSRFIQGLFAGPLVPLSQSVIVKVFPKEKKSMALSLWSSVIVVGPVLGPILGGWISYDYSWPWIFFINIPLGLFSLFTIRILLKKYETAKEKLPTDWIGLLLLAVGVSTLQFLLDKGEQFDWLHSPIIRTCAVTSFVCFVYLIAWEWTHKNPLIDLRIFKIRTYSLSVILFSLQYFVYFGTTILIPLWLQEYMGYTPIWAGLAIAPIGLFPAFLSNYAGKVTDRRGPFLPIGLSIALLAASSFVTAILYTNITFEYIALTRLLYGLAVSFFIAPSFIMMAMHVPVEKLPSASGTFQFFRAMTGAIGTSVFTTMWTRRMIHHHSNLVSQIVPDRPAVNHFHALLKQLGFSMEQTQALTEQMVTNQAAVLGLNEVFYLTGWIFIAMLAILLIGKRKKPVRA